METSSPTYLSQDTNRIENDPSNNSSVVPCVRCRGSMFTEPLPSNEMGI
jgi:hypothetical protein